MKLKNSRVWILQINKGETYIPAANCYDNVTENIAVVDDGELARAWMKLNSTGLTQGGRSFEIEMVNINVMHQDWLDTLTMFLNPLTNPLCRCKHTLMEHTSRGKRKCRHNHPKTHPDAHDCPGFRLRKPRRVK